MSEITYKQLKPLIVAEEQRGSSMAVTFQCPVSGQQVQANSPIRAGMASRTAGALKRSMFYSLRSSIASVVRSMVGGGSLGTVASTAVYSATSTTGGSTATFTKGDRKDAVVEAFKRVQHQFAWDEQRDGWVSSSAVQGGQSTFTTMLAGIQIPAGWDQSIVARMLAEIAAADGRIGPEEEQLFAAFGGTSVGSMRELVARPALTVAELQETTPQAREGMLMLAYAVAFADQSLEAHEQQRLQQFAQGLGIAPARAAELAGHAREHVVDQLLEVVYADRKIDAAEHAQVQRVAARLGMDPGTLAQLDARCRKRKGIF